MKYKIIVGSHVNETFMGIEFIKGIGFTEDKKKADYLKHTFRYEVEEIKETKPRSVKKKKVDAND